MRKTLILVAVVAAASATASSARAQSGFNDPFALYYGWYLPSQASLAARPTVENNLRFYSAQRQANVLADREDPFRDNRIIGIDELDPNRPLAGVGRPRRMIPHSGISNSNLRGSGVAGYHNSVTNYYPGLANRAGSSTSAAPMNVGRTGGNRLSPRMQGRLVPNRGGFGGGGMGGGGGFR